MAQQKNHVLEVPFFALCNNDGDVCGTAVYKRDAIDSPELKLDKFSLSRERGLRLGERDEEGTVGVHRIFDIHTASIAVFEWRAGQLRNDDEDASGTAVDKRDAIDSPAFKPDKPRSTTTAFTTSWLARVQAGQAFAAP